MKVNQQTVLISTNLVLVPYARHHVPVSNVSYTTAGSH